MSILPFLKKRKLAFLQGPVEEKLVRGSPEEILHDQAMTEFMDAHANKDRKSVRSALEAMVMHSFDWGDQDDGKK